MVECHAQEPSDVRDRASRHRRGTGEVLLHFCVALGIVSVYVLVSGRLRALRKYPFVFGPLYGIAAWLVMNFVVLPLTLIGHPRLARASVINGILIHMFGVGLPAALAASRIDKRPG